MYELQNINQDIVENYKRIIEQVEKKENAYKILELTLVNTFKTLIPDLDDKINKVFVILFLKPIFNLGNIKKVIRDFSDKELVEAKEIYHNNYSKIIRHIESKTDDMSKSNLELIDYIYELLEYDKVIESNYKKYLYSFSYINAYYLQYKKALEQLELLLKSKPAEKNIDIATNTNSAYKDKTKFLETILNDKLLNPYSPNRDILELQLEFIKSFAGDYRRMARSIYTLSTIQKYTDDINTNVIGDLEAYLDSDMEITKEDLYMSWYANVFTIYDNSKISLSKKLKLARLSSHVIFPELKNNKSFKVTEYTAKKPIRERAFFKGLRLLEFTDNRLKIIKSDEEIESTEAYFKELTFFLNKYMNDTTITTS